MGEQIRKNELQEIVSELRDFRLSSLPPSDLRYIADCLLHDTAKVELQSEVNKADFDSSAKIAAWLAESSSARTRLTYKRAMTIFQEFLQAHSFHFLDVTPYIADQFRDSLRAEDSISGVSIKVYLSCISAFYSKLEYWQDIQVNPFRGQKRKFNIPIKPAPIPTKQEIEELITSFLEDQTATGRGSHLKRKAAIPTASAVLIMAYRGLRIGAFDTLQIKEGGSFIAQSKGKRIAGNLNEGKTGKDLYARLKRIGFQPNTAFPAATTLQRNIDRRIALLFTKKFSSHSFRHFFAVQEYLHDKDMYRIKWLLHHASIATTERYLKNLNII